MGVLFNCEREHLSLMSVDGDAFVPYYRRMAAKAEDILDRIKFSQACDNRIAEIERFNFNQLRVKEVVFDCDGVFADWTTYMLENHLSKYTDIRSFNHSDDKEEVLKEVYKKDPHVFAKLPVRPEAYVLVKLFNYLHEQGIKVKVLTAVGVEHHDFELVKKDKIAYLGVLGIRAKDIVVVRESADKKAFVQKGSLLVDDYGANCREWAKGGGLAIKWKGLESLEVVAQTLLDRNNLDITPCVT